MCNRPRRARVTHVNYTNHKNRYALICRARFSPTLSNPPPDLGPRLFRLRTPTPSPLFKRKILFRGGKENPSEQGGGRKKTRWKQNVSAYFPPSSHIFPLHPCSKRRRNYRSIISMGIKIKRENREYPRRHRRNFRQEGRKGRNFFPRGTRVYDEA